MPDRDMTPGELTVKLDAILSALGEVKDTMLTKAVFETWQQGNDRRIQRVEDDLKEWIKESTEAHVSLDKDSKARHQETGAEIEKVNTAVRAKIEKDVKVVADEVRELKNERAQDEKDLKAARRAVVNLWIAGAVTIVVSVIIKFWPSFGS